MKYKKYPIPLEAWKNFKTKQQKMSATLTSIIGKPKTIPLSKIILATSEKSLFLDDAELVKLANHRRKR